MTEKVWLLWMILGAIFLVAEMLTAGFFILWFGIGAIVAGFIALLGFGHAWQLVAFIVVSGVLFAVSRRFAERVSDAQPPGIGADRFVAQNGIVIEEISNTADTGRVRTGSEEWRAKSADGSVIPKETEIEVIKVKGTHLIVQTLKKGDS